MRRWLNWSSFLEVSWEGLPSRIDFSRLRWQRRSKAAVFHDEDPQGYYWSTVADGKYQFFFCHSRPKKGCLQNIWTPSKGRQYVTMSFCMFRFNLTVLSWLWLVLILGSYLLLISTCHVGWWLCGLPLQWSWCLSLSLLRQVLRQKVLSHCAWTLAAPSKDQPYILDWEKRNVSECVWNPKFSIALTALTPLWGFRWFQLPAVLELWGQGGLATTLRNSVIV